MIHRSNGSTFYFHPEKQGNLELSWIFCLSLFFKFGLDTLWIKDF